MTLILYIATAAALLALTHRYVFPLTHTAAIVLFLLPLCFTGRALFTNAVYAPVDLVYEFPPLAGLAAEYGIEQRQNVFLSDIYAQMIPWRKAVQWSYTRGLWPIWNPFTLSGDILAAAAQPAAYSPFTLIALLLPVAQSMTFTAAVTFLIAGIGAFAFCRALGCRELVAFIAAAAWMYSTAISFFVLWPIGASWALLPLVLLAVRRVALRPTFGSGAFLAAVFVLLILAGHPETVLHLVAIAGGYGIFEVLRARQWRAIGMATAAGVVALLICAVYLLPILEAVPQTAEHEFRLLFPPQGVSIESSAARLAVNVFPFLHIASWTRGVNVPIDTAGVGSLILAAAIFGLWRVRSPESWFFGGLLLFSLIAQSQPPWFEDAIHVVPLFDLALNSRFSFAAAFCLVVLAALGLEHATRGLAITFVAVLVLLAAGTWWFSHADFVTIRQHPWTEYKVVAELALLALASVVFFLRLPSRIALTAFLALLLMQRVAEEGRAYPTIPARMAYPDVPLFDWMNRDLPFRIVGVGKAFPPGTSALYELEDVRGYQAMTFAPYADIYPIWCVDQPVWFNRVDDLTRPLISFLNVRYAITSDGDAIPNGWREVRVDRGARLLENQTFTPRVFVPKYVRLGIDSKWEIEEMRAESDFRERAWIRADMPPHERVNGPGFVVVRPLGNDYALDVDMTGNGWVVASIPAWRGWRAYIDDRRVATQTANHAFLGIYVPQGRHTVRLVYLPRSFVVGRAITIATLTAIVTALLLRHLRKLLLQRRDRSVVSLSLGE
jgi:membrane protein YfhO